MAYLVIEIVLVVPSSLAIANGAWKMNVWMWRNLKRQRNSQWIRDTKNWKPTGAQIAPTHQVKIATVIAVGVTSLVLFSTVLFLVLRR